MITMIRLGIKRSIFFKKAGIGLVGCFVFVPCLDKSQKLGRKLVLQSFRGYPLTDERS